MQKTSNYNLNKPEVTDPMRLADFNENADIMDAALAGLNTAVSNMGNCKIMTGSWIGDGTSKRTIQLPVTPKLLFIFFDYIDDAENWPTFIIAVDGIVRFLRGYSNIAFCGDPLLIDFNGDTVTISHVKWGNSSGQIVNYVVLY